MEEEVAKLEQKNIDTLEELEYQKAKLQMATAVTKAELGKSLIGTREEIKKLVISQIAVPAGMVGLGTLLTFVLTKLVSSTSKKEVKHVKNAVVKTKKPIISKGVIATIIPMALSLVQGFIFKKKQQKIESQERVIESSTVDVMPNHSEAIS